MSRPPGSCAHSAARRVRWRPKAFSTLLAAKSSATHYLPPQRACLCLSGHFHLPHFRSAALRSCAWQARLLAEMTSRHTLRAEGAGVDGDRSRYHLPLGLPLRFRFRTKALTNSGVSVEDPYPASRASAHEPKHPSPSSVD